MNEKQMEIYNVICEIEKLDSYVYSNLLSVYGEDLVNQVFEKILSENDNNSYKLEYYVSKIMIHGDKVTTDLYDAYTSDMDLLPCLTKGENIELSHELHGIINELNKLVNVIGYNGNSVWISDKVDYCLDECIDPEILLNLKKLYGKFIYIRNKLVEGNLKLVISFSKQFYKSGCDFNEVVQLGNTGFMRAVEKYNPAYNACLSTYAYHWVKQSIIRNIPYIYSTVTFPYHLIGLNMSINKVVRELRLELGRDPLIEEVADYMEIPVSKIKDIKLNFLDPISLDEPVRSPSESNSGFSIIDTIVDDKVSVEDQVFAKQMSEDVMHIVRNCLTEQEYNIICHRFALDNYEFLTLEEIGKTMGVTRERIRQIENRAKKKIFRRRSKLQVYLT